MYPLYFNAIGSSGDHHLISVFGEKKKGWQVSFDIYCTAHSNFRNVKKVFRHLRIEEV